MLTNLLGVHNFMPIVCQTLRHVFNGVAIVNRDFKELIDSHRLKTNLGTNIVKWTCNTFEVETINNFFNFLWLQQCFRDTSRHGFSSLSPLTPLTLLFLFLPIARREIVVKIEAGLADRHQTLARTSMHRAEFVEIVVRTFAGFVRVNSGRHEHVVVRFENPGGVISIGGRGGDRDHAIDALFGGSFDQGLRLFGQLRKCQVAMRIDQHREILASAAELRHLSEPRP